MNKQLTQQVIIIAAVSAFLYVAVAHLLPNNGADLGPLRQQYGMIAASGTAAAGLMVVRYRYGKQKQEPTSPTKPFSFDDLTTKQNPKQADADKNENPLSKLFEEIETGKPPTRNIDQQKQPSMEEVLERKILQKIAAADVKVSLNVKLEDEKWKVESAECTISTGEKPQTKPPEPPKVQKRDG